MAFKDVASRWAGHFTGALTFWSVLPSSVVGLITAYLAAGVGWIIQFGAFGIFASGLGGFAIASFGLSQTAKMNLYRAETKMRARVSGESSPFDPMSPVYENKRLYLRDLAPLGRRMVLKKRFVNCEIIGPGTAVIGLTTDPAKPSLMRDTSTFDVDCIEIDPSKRSQLAIDFYDCDFDGCKFYHMSLLFLRRENDLLHWITKSQEQLLLPDAGGSSNAAR